MNYIDYIVIGIYLLLSVLLGCRKHAKQTTTEQYFLAGRNMKWLPVAIALFAALFSSISYIAMPGEAFNFGCTLTLGGIINILALPVMLFIFLRFFYDMKLWTINEYLEKRFSVTVRIICGSLFLVARCLYLGVVLYATAMLLTHTFGISAFTAVLLTGVVSTIYTYFGGMEATIWTDVMQFVVLLGGVLLVIGVVAWELPGGIGGIWEIAQENHRTFNIGPDSGFWDMSMTERITIWPWLIGLPFAMFLPATEQINLQRCMTCKNFKEVTRAISTSTICNPFICFIFYFSGLAVFAYFKVLHPELAANSDGDNAFCHFISHYLPVGTRGILVAGIMAAVMSTISAVENSLATVWVKDVYQRVLVINRDDRHYVKAAKLSTFAIGTIACVFGLSILMIFGGRDIPLLEVSNVILGMIGTFTSAIFLLGLLTYRTSARGMVVGLIVGAPVVIYSYIFRYLLAEPSERWSFMLVALPTTITILVVAYGYSLLTGGAAPQTRRYVIWSRWNRKDKVEQSDFNPKTLR